MANNQTDFSWMWLFAIGGGLWLLSKANTTPAPDATAAADYASLAADDWIRAVNANIEYESKGGRDYGSPLDGTSGGVRNLPPGKPTYLGPPVLIGDTEDKYQSPPYVPPFIRF